MKPNIPKPWYKNAIFYAIDVERFQDSNADGIGDFPGLTSRLPYLAELGVTCIWLLPFFPSPNRDNRYDTQDYYEVDPQLGTLTDFTTFLHKAGENGMRVVLDLVMNHTSDEHPWFQASRRDPNCRFRDYYIWAENPPPVPPGKGSIFPGEETSVWTYDEMAKAYFFHRFYHFQPELNVTNPEVIEEIKKVMDFWLSFGISGFRVDAASHLIELAGVEENVPGDLHDILRDLRAFVSKRASEAALIGEADVEPENLARYFGDNDELNLLFNFALNNQLFLALATEDGEPIRRSMRELPAIPQSCQWANFLRNMDELDLERLTDEQRQKVFERFAPKEDMRIYNRGIRRRLAPMLQGDHRRLQLAFSLLFSLHGTPVITYGDEIGMGEDLSCSGRNAVRVPMQWSGNNNAGFSEAAKKKLIQPVVSNEPLSYEKINVEEQKNDPDSFLNWMKRLIYTRRACPEIGYGSWHALQTKASRVIAYRYAWKDGLVITVHNLSGKKQLAEIELSDQQGRRLEDLFTEDPALPLDKSDFRIELEPYGYRWYRVGGQRDGRNG